MTTHIFVYCDDPSHPSRRRVVAVTNFVHIGGRDEGRWNERFTSTAAQGTRESGVTLLNDARLPADDVIHRPGGFQGEAIRSRYQLTCRKCPRRPVTAREENLFSALNTLAANGMSKVSLVELAAMLQRQSEST